tara:strand:- start:3110 stop:3784 length:675 start_codon:yes stop_codon:yes gene_type:complete
MCDLLIIVSWNKKEDILEKTIQSLDKIKFNNKYLIFDCAPDSLFKVDYDKFTKLKKEVKLHYPDYEIIENLEYLEYRRTLERFLRANYTPLAKNLFVIKSNIILDNLDLEKVLECKSSFSECRILYFRENILRLNQWFSAIDDDSGEDKELIKTHGFCENCFISTKEDLIHILNNLPSDKNFIDYHYKKNIHKKWENFTHDEQLEYWKNWGIYEHKNIRHKIIK